MSTFRAVAIGCGSYLPKKVLTNADLAKMVDTSDDWIQSRTGIKRRHIAADDELTSDLALAAAKEALRDAGLEGTDIDLIILATSTPDLTFPATATAVQANIGMTAGFAFDVQAVCSGFVYAMAVADNFIKAGQVKRALVIGAETFSRILDWEDRSTCVLFGDGAGAVILEAREHNGDKKAPGIISSHLHSDGRLRDSLYVDGGPGSTKTTGYLRMKGKEVFRHAVVNLAAVVEEALEANGMSVSDIDWIVPHQANKRILDSTAKKLSFPAEKMIITVDDHANTSAASIPLALCTAVKDGRIKQGDILLMEAMGGGFTWGAVVMRW